MIPESNGQTLGGLLNAVRERLISLFDNELDLVKPTCDLATGEPCLLVRTEYDYHSPRNHTGFYHFVYNFAENVLLVRRVLYWSDEQTIVYAEMMSDYDSRFEHIVADIAVAIQNDLLGVKPDKSIDLDKLLQRGETLTIGDGEEAKIDGVPMSLTYKELTVQKFCEYLANQLERKTGEHITVQINTNMVSKYKNWHLRVMCLVRAYYFVIEFTPFSNQVALYKSNRDCDTNSDGCLVEFDRLVPAFEFVRGISTAIAGVIDGATDGGC